MDLTKKLPFNSMFLSRLAKWKKKQVKNLTCYCQVSKVKVGIYKKMMPIDEYLLMTLFF